MRLSARLTTYFRNARPRASSSESLETNSTSKRRPTRSSRTDGLKDTYCLTRSKKKLMRLRNSLEIKPVRSKV
jgi:hypothetical protein